MSSIRAIRLILTGILVYFIYGETGPFTAVTIVLLSTFAEIQTELNKGFRDVITKIVERMGYDK